MVAHQATLLKISLKFFLSRVLQSQSSCLCLNFFFFFNGKFQILFNMFYFFKFFSSIDFFHMIFYIVILPSLFKLYLVYLVTNILLVTHAFNNLNVYRLQIDKDMYYFLKKKRRTKGGLQHLQHI